MLILPAPPRYSEMCHVLFLPLSLRLSRRAARHQPCVACGASADAGVRPGPRRNSSTAPKLPSPILVLPLEPAIFWPLTRLVKTPKGAMAGFHKQLLGDVLRPGSKLRYTAKQRMRLAGG
jgi:hypothetical protein